MKRSKRSNSPANPEVQLIDTPSKKRREIHKTKGREKKEKWKFDAENTGGPYSFSSEEFPARADGEFAGYTIEEIRSRVGKRFAEKKRVDEKPDYIEVVHQILDELGYPEEKWKRGAILSSLSKAVWRKRKARAAQAEQKRLQDAQAAELNHSLPLDID